MLYIDQDFTYSSSQNMALDSYLIEKIEDQVILRIYEFSRPSITLGFAMKPKDVFESIPDHIDCSKRVTGGKALTHDQGLTYSIHIPRSMIAEGLQESYKILSQPIYDALFELNPDVKFTEDQLFNDRQNPICFMEHKVETITLNGAKIVGSAQKRTKNCILQHGEINVFPSNIDLSKLIKTKNSQNFSNTDYTKRCSSLMDRAHDKDSKEIKKRIKQLILKNFEKKYGKSTPYPIKSLDQNAIDFLAKKLKINL
ncbi:MAG: hypothetical protein KC646_11160 [Candidatus Cloacimonetes bacterium]|nr:hypothetical protein [Candidatus Cloacimonadota bacterium]